MTTDSIVSLLVHLIHNNLLVTRSYNSRRSLHQPMRAGFLPIQSLLEPPTSMNITMVVLLPRFSK